MEFKYNDGGRSKYFKASNVGDCVTRAIANATSIDYKEIYDSLNKISKCSRKSKRESRPSQSRNGVHTRIAKKYIEDELGWVWVPLMGIGTGCQVHLNEKELPSKGNYILNLSKHLTCIRDGVLVDTYDCSRDGSRCVYGYWRAPTASEKRVHDDTKALGEEYETFVESQKQDLSKRKEEVKKHNTTITKRYAKRINKLKAQLRKLERERDSQLLPMPKMESNAWAKKGK